MKPLFSFFALQLLLFSVHLSSALGSPNSVKLLDRQGSFVIPSSYDFKDESGRAVTLAPFFNSERPVLLTFIYYECPGACTLLLNALLKGLTPHVLLPGKDFEIVVISINPKDTSDLAKAKKETYLKRYERIDTREGWHFLVGSENMIQALTSRLGFYFEKSETGDQYNHPSALYFLTPDGLVSSQMSGFDFPSVQVRGNLIAAKNRALGSWLGKISAYCYTFTPHIGFLDRPSRWFLLLAILFAGCGFVYLRSKRREKSLNLN